MKLHTLQLFLRSLTVPLAECNASGAAEELRAACDLLASYSHMDLGQFKDLVSQAEEYQKAKEIRIPRYLHAAVSCYERLRSLKERAASGPSGQEELARDLLGIPLDDLEKLDLVSLATELGASVASKAKKDEAIDAIWRAITGGPRPKKTAASTKKATAAFALEEYTQKVKELKERANSPEATREDLEKGIKELGLDKLAAKNLISLARELACPVNSKTTKGDAIQAIRRSVLLVHETRLGTAS